MILASPARIRYTPVPGVPCVPIPWGALDVEVSDPEIGPYAHTLKEIDGELVQFSAYFGFGELQPVELVDLQLLWNAGPDLASLHRLCVRTFDWQRQQVWPPLPLRLMDGWSLAYADARAETEVGGQAWVLPDVAAARDWLGRVIDTIASSQTLG